MDEFYEYHRPDGTIEYRNVRYDEIVEEMKRIRADAESHPIPEPTAEDEMAMLLTARASEYPPMEDFLDAWVKNDAEALNKYREDCLAVKEKYPKPE